MIIFMAPYPKDYDTDGMFQRVRAIDQLVNSKKRIYVSFSKSKSKNNHWHILRELEFSLRPLEVVIHTLNPISYLYFFYLIFLSKIIYVHSLYSIAAMPFRLLLCFPIKKIILDFHGLPVEEMLFLSKSVESEYYKKIENKIVKKCGGFITVSENMKNFYLKKYPYLNDDKFINLPIFNHYNSNMENQKFSKNTNCEILYSGGIQKWQNIDEMFKYIEKNVNFRITFFSPNILELHTYACKHNVLDRVEIKHLSFNDLMKQLKDFQFGFVLRDDLELNSVACPTKIIEYLQFGIIPIMKSCQVGDFKKLGLKFISVDNLGQIFTLKQDEIINMMDSNFKVLVKLKEQSEIGKGRLKDLMDFYLNESEINLPIEKIKQNTFEEINL